MAVYKYMCSNGFKDMFKNQKPTFLYRRIDKLNDPYENMVGIEEYTKRVFNWTKSSENMKSLKDFDFSLALMAGQFQVREESELCESMKKCFYVLSLSNCYDNLLLWAHYADMHKGVVIELDDNNPVFNRREDEFISSLFSINYDTVRKIPSFSTPETYYELVSSIGVTAIKLLENKSSDWRYEKEMRQVLTDTRPMYKLFSNQELKNSKKSDLVYCENINAWLLSVDYSVVKKVHLGLNFDTRDILNQETINKLKQNNIPIHKMELVKDEYKLKSVPKGYA